MVHLRAPPFRIRNECSEGKTQRKTQGSSLADAKRRKRHSSTFVETEGFGAIGLDGERDEKVSSMRSIGLRSRGCVFGAESQCGRPQTVAYSSTGATNPSERDTDELGEDWNFTWSRNTKDYRNQNS